MAHTLFLSEQKWQDADPHPAAYSMVCGSHEGFATWCRMLRYNEDLETTFRTVSSELEKIDHSQHISGDLKAAHLPPKDQRPEGPMA